jgi:tetratricopeptide (TPR) repeat protein
MTWSTRTDTGLKPAAWCLALAAVVITVGTPVAVTAQEAPTTDVRDRARQLFRQGQARYDLGQYQEAVALFEEAYELAPAPLLLFNIAQSYRRLGRCPQALASYRSFVRLATPETPERAEAETRIRALEAQCRPPPAPSSDSVSSVGPPAPSSPPRPVDGEGSSSGPRRRPSTRTLAITALGAGTALAGAALGLQLWNDGRHARWEREDRALLRAGAGEPGAVTRQAANDALIRSIRSSNRLTMGLAVVSFASLVTAAVLPLVRPDPYPLAVTASRRDVTVAWHRRW